MSKNIFRIGRVSILFVFIASIAFGQSTPFVSTNPSQILSAFQAARGNWLTNIAGYANALFGSLALIEFAWSAAVMVLEKADLQSWTAALVRKIMWIGAFYMLLIKGPTWIPFIIDSFTQIGQNSSGVVSISPSDVFGQGLAVAGALSNGFSVAGFLTQPAVILALVIAAIIVVISYAMITIQFMVAMVESYIVVAAGFIFLGFGGSRWTVPYAERYIGLAVSNGVKIFVIYLLISVGTNLGNVWIAEAQGASTSGAPEMVALDVMAAALMYMMLCWQIPKLFSAVLGGSPALGGGDLISAGSSLVLGAAAVAGVASGGAGVMAGGARAYGGVGAAASVGGGGALGVGGAGDVGVAGSGGSVPPPGPTGSGQGSGSGNPRQPEPPAGSATATDAASPNGPVGQAGGAAGKAQDKLGAVSSQMRNLGRRLNTVLPPDHAPHSTPPRMDVDHHE